MGTHAQFPVPSAHLRQLIHIPLLCIVKDVMQYLWTC
jgi:hypothetical protein